MDLFENVGEDNSFSGFSSGTRVDDSLELNKCDDIYDPQNCVMENDVVVNFTENLIGVYGVKHQKQFFYGGYADNIIFIKQINSENITKDDSINSGSFSNLSDSSTISYKDKNKHREQSTIYCNINFLFDTQFVQFELYDQEFISKNVFKNYEFDNSPVQLLVKNNNKIPTLLEKKNRISKDLTIGDIYTVPSYMIEFIIPSGKNKNNTKRHLSVKNLYSRMKWFDDSFIRYKNALRLLKIEYDHDVKNQGNRYHYDFLKNIINEIYIQSLIVFQKSKFTYYNYLISCEIQHPLSVQDLSYCFICSSFTYKDKTRKRIKNKSFLEDVNIDSSNLVLQNAVFYRKLKIHFFISHMHPQLSQNIEEYIFSNDDIFKGYQCFYELYLNEIKHIDLKMIFANSNLNSYSSICSTHPPSNPINYVGQAINQVIDTDPKNVVYCDENIRNVVLVSITYLFSLIVILKVYDI